jgi:RNA polymerase sigma-70 factor (ECF subfamily)
MLDKFRRTALPAGSEETEVVAKSAPTDGTGETGFLGNNREFDQTYREHFAFVWRSLQRLGVGKTTLDDAVQDVFIVAFRRASEFRARSSYRTWLFGIAANVARDHRRKGHRAEAFEPMPDQLHSPRASPLEQASDAQALRFIEQFVMTLGNGKRDVFILAELEQMTAPEIAEALGIKLNTVYSRLRAARESFGNMLERLMAR